MGFEVDPKGTLEPPKGTVPFGKGLARTLPWTQLFLSDYLACAGLCGVHAVSLTCVGLCGVHAVSLTCVGLCGVHAVSLTCAGLCGVHAVSLTCAGLCGVHTVSLTCAGFVVCTLSV